MTTLSSRRNLVTLVGLIAAASLAAAYFFVLRSEESSAAAQPISKPATRTPASASPQARQGAAAAAPAQTAVEQTLARAFRRRPVVVVSLYASDVPLDRLARAEATAGARDAGAGFVAIDVVSAKHSEAIALGMGVVSAPAVLVLRRPGKLVTHLAGVIDRVAVAQAAADARQ